MSKPIPVQLVPYDPFWADIAEDEIIQLKAAFGPSLVAVHHIGSTAIPSINARPIIDLLVVVRPLNELEESENHIEAIGYVRAAELALGRLRYWYKNEPETNTRLFQLFCFEENNEAIQKHLAFRDFLRLHKVIANKYETLKTVSQEKYPEDSHAYSICKSRWINQWEQQALAYFK